MDLSHKGVKLVVNRLRGQKRSAVYTLGKIRHLLDGRWDKRVPETRKGVGLDICHQRDAEAKLVMI